MTDIVERLRYFSLARSGELRANPDAVMADDAKAEIERLRAIADTDTPELKLQQEEIERLQADHEQLRVEFANETQRLRDELARANRREKPVMDKQCDCDWATGECQGPLGCKALAENERLRNQVKDLTIENAQINRDDGAEIEQLLRAIADQGAEIHRLCEMGYADQQEMHRLKTELARANDPTWDTKKPAEQ